MKLRSQFFIFFLFFLLLACKQENKTRKISFAPKVIEAKGHLVSKDSIQEARTTLGGIPQTIITGTPKISLTNLNVRTAGTPSSLELNPDSFKKIIHLADEFSLPKIIATSGKMVRAGIPEIVIAKDATTKDINPGNFSFYKILQGLKTNSIRCMLQDKTGNLWFGTLGGGVTRYDGKYFTNYTQQEGLSHNVVFSMLEDRSGNLWFGTYGGGLSRFDGKCFTNFTDKDGLCGNHINTICEDKAGKIWIGSNGAGLSVYDGKSFTTYRKKEGLSDDAICSLCEDKIGNLWIGTYSHGVMRYDGNRIDAIERGEKIPLQLQHDLKRKNGKLLKSFTYFTQKEGLCYNSVWAIMEDKIGNLWFGTASGSVSKYDGNIVDAIERGEKIPLYCQKNIKSKNGKLIRSFSNFSKNEGLNDNSVQSILEDKSGNIWFGTYGAGILKYDGNRIDELESNSAITQQTTQDLKKENGKFVKTFTSFTDKEGLSNNIIETIFEDRSENLWVGTVGGGVLRYDGKSFTNFTEKESLISSPFTFLLEDKKGNIWIATYSDGVYCYTGKSLINYTEKEGLCGNSVNSILEDKFGKLWFGTRGGGLSRFDGKTFTNFTEKDSSLIFNYVDALLEDRVGNIWIGTHGAGAIRYDGNRIEEIERGVKIPLSDQRGLKKENGKFVKTFTSYSTKEGLREGTVSTMLEDKSGNIWFGSTNGVSCYNGKNFTHFTTKEGLGSDNIAQILEDRTGNIWFATSKGACRYNGRSFINFTEKEGLSASSVINILQDKEGNLWFGTRKGLSKLSMDKLANIDSLLKHNFNPVKEAFFYNYGYNDGFIGANCKRNCALQDAKGKIWWASDILTCYNPSGIKIDTAAPIVNLTSIKLFGEDVVWANLNTVATDSTGKDIITERLNDTLLSNGIILKDIKFDGLSKWYNLPTHLSLPYNNNNLTFSFIGAHIQSRNHIKYQYKLEGADLDWSSITDRTEAPYGNLPGGNYTFMVKAMNQSGIWSEPFKFEFEVRPPWWKTWWFRVLVGLVIVGSIVFYIKKRERILKARQKILEQTVKERTLEVVQQKHVIEEKHKEITDSINYAERIQRSLLASKKLLDENLKDYFILFKPKDVVSGDFYWAAKINNGNFIIATADSTGHGVPGAIMSILNIACLDKAVTKEINRPDLILNETRSLIIEHLKNDGSSEGGKDGMDGSLLSFDFKNNVLTCACANNPVWIIRKYELLEIKADRFPIGKHDKDKTPYTLHTLNLQKGDVVYTLTDGFADQFGGASGKKFKYKQLQDLLLQIIHEPMEIQKQKLSETFDNWKGNLEQIDDVCLIGIRI